MALKLQDIIDIEQFQMLQDRLNEIYSFPSAIIGRTYARNFTGKTLNPKKSVSRAINTLQIIFMRQSLR
jgi:hypothetical protein